MQINDIVALAHAGFTAEQIAALAAAPQPAQQPAQQPAPPPAPQPAPQPAGGDDPITKLMQQMGALTAAVQTANIKQSNQPQPQTADEILAEIIAPPIKKKEES